MLENPFRKDLYYKNKAAPSIFVIFGASGDLAKRKLIPSLFKLYLDELLPENFKIVGFARTVLSKENYIADLKKYFTYDEKYNCFFNKLEYFTGNYDEHKDYVKFKTFLKKLDDKNNIPGNRVFYLSTPPKLSKTIISMLTSEKLISKNPQTVPWGRIVVEKPFGHNLESAIELNLHLTSHVNEEQIYRIDHYLGKETVQNIVMFRFANTLFEPTFNNNYINHVQMTVAETLGVENRAGYFDQTGILRDMIQNHMLQLLSLITMEPPSSLTSKNIHAEKIKIFTSLRKYSPGDALKSSIRAQYKDGMIGEKLVTAFLKEKGISDTSTTETYSAIKLFIDNPRWAGVPFYLRSGKRLARKNSEIMISFKNPLCSLFEGTPIKNLVGNSLVIHVQPHEGITLKMNSKTPGFNLNLSSVNMEFLYGNTFGKKKIDAYDRLLHDVLIGDATLYARGEEVIESWKFINPILSSWENEALKQLPTYEAGSDGPDGAKQFIEKDGFSWRKI